MDYGREMHYLHSQSAFYILSLCLVSCFLLPTSAHCVTNHSAMEKPTLLCLTDSTSSDSPLHSSSLHTAESVSDMDEKMKAITTLLEEDGHCQNRKLQIKYMLEEYNRSYQSLAEKYDYLRFLFLNILCSGSSSSSDAEIFQYNINNYYKGLEGIHPDSKMATRSLDLESVAVAGSLKCNNDIFNKEFLVKLRDELVSSKLCNQSSENLVEVRDKHMYGRNTDHSDMDEFEIRQVKDVHPSVAIARWESTWSELNSQVTMLMEENLQHQEELTSRNNEKREAIKELQQQIEGLKSENRASRFLSDSPKKS